MEVLERFLRYVSYDTQSDASSKTVPSTEKQLALGHVLVEELKGLGVADAAISEYGVVTGTVAANEAGRPALGFLAHYDTSPDCSGANVKPRIIQNYDGSDVVLDAEGRYVLRADEDSTLSMSVGEDLIVTDGTTLLGADDKAGVAEIMTLVHELFAHPEWKHGKICVGFTPDEEIGSGADHFDVAAFGADFAYTVDGGPVGELEYENFNGTGAVVTVRGKGIHPGSAKNRMINASTVAMAFHALLPAAEVPEHTEGYEGFFHLTSVQGNVEECKLEYIVRDHDAEKLEHRKQQLMLARDFLNAQYEGEPVQVVLTESYRNMKEMILPHPELIENAKRAMEKLGITPIITPIRGGTDGARLSYMGLPCPNLCTGGSCGHGRFEHVTAQAMERVVKLLVELALSCGK